MVYAKVVLQPLQWTRGYASYVGCLHEGAGARILTFVNDQIPASSILNDCGGMPWFSGLLNDRKVADVVAYIRTHSGNNYKYVLNPADIAFMRQNLTQAVE